MKINAILLALLNVSSYAKDAEKIDPCQATLISVDGCFDTEAKAESCKTCIEENMEPNTQDSIRLRGAPTQEKLTNAIGVCTMEGASCAGCSGQLMNFAACRSENMPGPKPKPPADTKANAKNIDNKEKPCQDAQTTVEECLPDESVEGCKTCLSEKTKPSAQDSVRLRGAPTPEQMISAIEECTMRGESCAGCSSELMGLAACWSEIKPEPKTKPPVDIETAQMGQTMHAFSLFHTSRSLGQEMTLDSDWRLGTVIEEAEIGVR